MGDDSDAAVIVASPDDPARFGALFDRHATVLYRYLVRRVGAADAEHLLGDLFLVAFEKRATYDPDRRDARPWLYGIATNLLARNRRSEAPRLHARARRLPRESGSDDVADEIAASLDATVLWPRIADAVNRLPENERDT